MNAKERIATIGDGVLPVDKPIGWTSHDAVANLRRLLNLSRIGHGGTLDPAATGVLPILVGRGTRIAEYLLDWDKEYHAVLRLGETTDTQDATGIVVSRSPVGELRPEVLQSVVDRFRGRIHQVPPMYSAVKMGGVPLYKAARAGRTVERQSREVMIHELEVLGREDRDISLRVRCSKGTYIRTLCSDIGAALGVGGHLLRLVRIRVGPLTLEQAATLEEWTAPTLAARLLTVDQATAHLPALTITQAAADRASHGVPVPGHAVLWERSSDAAEGFPPRTVRIKDPDGRLVGIGRFEPLADRPGEGRVAVQKVLMGGDESEH